MLVLATSLPTLVTLLTGTGAARLCLHPVSILSDTFSGVPPLPPLSKISNRGLTIPKRFLIKSCFH